MHDIVDLDRHPLSAADYRAACRDTLERNGVLVLSGFLRPPTVQQLRSEGAEHQRHAYFTASDHNIYLAANDDALSPAHPRNRRVSSSKGCITTDQIPDGSALRALYDSDCFKHFLGAVLGEPELHPYADPLSSINLHYASAGQELGWHFDNSSFAITLLVQKPQAGGTFEYVRDARSLDTASLDDVLAGERPASQLTMNEGDLVLFRGRDALHRVTPTQGDVTRMLAVLAYNAEPDVSLSESARLTFYGRLG